MSGQPYVEPAAGATALSSTVTPGHDSVGPKLDEKQIEHVEQTRPLGIDDDGMVVDGVHNAGMAIIEQAQVIPKTGRRMPTGKWEYITFCLYCESQSSSLTFRRDADCHQTLPITVLPSAVTVVLCVNPWHLKPIPPVMSVGAGKTSLSTVCSSI